MRRVLLGLLALLVLGLPRPMLAAEQCFAHDKTPYCLTDQFNDYWNANGGLAVFGYPLSSELNEWNADAQALFPTQWLERNRFEYHAENAGTPYAVLLGLLGKEALAQQGRDWAAAPREAGPQAGCLWFEQTGHNVCNQSGSLGFKAYWESHGLQVAGLDAYARSLQLFGLPLTAPTMETNSSGDTVLTQWFERARFEWHPNNPAEFKVLLGLLGRDELKINTALQGEILYVVTEGFSRYCCNYTLKSAQAAGGNPSDVSALAGVQVPGIFGMRADGQQIALDSPHFTALLARRDGSQGQTLDASSIENIDHVAWSPDGQHLALGGFDLHTGQDGGSSKEIRVAITDAQGTPEWFLDKPAAGHVAWSSDSQQVAFISRAGLTIADATGASRVLATPALPATFNGPLFWIEQDHTIIVLTSEIDMTDPLHSFPFNQVYAIDVATGAQTALTSDRTTKSCVRLSPDRQWLALSTGNGAEVMRINGSERRMLGYTVGAWSPDSRYLLVLDGWSSALWAVARDGSERILVKGGERSTSFNIVGCGEDKRASSIQWLPSDTHIK